ncbi:hypothetical protein Ciccas_002684 [Cichlidogyrus casuarinus]|uniref:Uncharacterized protein n=1 Tax=Cichlidogyrus casuarinus TaxID=1844966 RepID=A0ABD2QGI9_9PLAT
MGGGTAADETHGDKEADSLPVIGSNLVKAVWLIRNHRNNVDSSELIEERLSCLQNGLKYLTNLSADQLATLFCQHLQTSFLGSDSLIMSSPIPDQGQQAGETALAEGEPMAKVGRTSSPISMQPLYGGNSSGLLSSVLMANDQKEAWRRAQMTSKLMAGVTPSPAVRFSEAAMPYIPNKAAQPVITSDQTKQTSLLDDLLKRSLKS